MVFTASLRTTNSLVCFVSVNFSSPLPCLVPFSPLTGNTVPLLDSASVAGTPLLSVIARMEKVSHGTAAHYIIHLNLFSGEKKSLATRLPNIIIWSYICCNLRINYVLKNHFKLKKSKQTAFQIPFSKIRTHCCPKDSPVGLIVGRPAAFVPNEGDYSALLALRKWKVKTFLHYRVVSTVSFLKASRAE